MNKLRNKCDADAAKALGLQLEVSTCYLVPAKNEAAVREALFTMEPYINFHASDDFYIYKSSVYIDIKCNANNRTTVLLEGY